MFLSFNLSRIQKVLLLGVLPLVLAGCPSGQPMGFVPAQTVPTPVVSDPIVSPSQPVNPGAEIGISIRVDSVGGVALTYEWIPDEGKGKILAGEGTSAITYQVPTEPGTYSIRVKVTGADVTIERSTFINVHETEAPGPTLTDTEQPATTDILSPTIYLTLTLTSTPIPPTNMPPPTETPTVSICLASEEVRSWCEGASCNSERFEQLQEGNDVINPCGVKLKKGDPVAFNIPKEVSVDVSDCFNASNVTGPVQLPHVCEASFRRSLTNTPTSTPSPAVPPTSCNATPHTGLAQGNHTFNGVAHVAELWRANGQTPWGDKLVTAAVMGDLNIIEAGGSVWTYPEGCQEVAKREAAESTLRTGAILITEAEMRDVGLIE